MGPPEGTVPKGAKFLGVLNTDPTTAELIASDEPGWWWFNSTDGSFKYWDGDDVSIVGGTYIKEIDMPAGQFGLPNTNPPSLVDQDNITLYKFTVNTDKITVKWEIPSDYDGGDVEIELDWTNDGGVDDNGKNVKWQLDFQTTAIGGAVSGSHASSPLSIEDTYESASGWILHETGGMDIPEAAITGKNHIFMKLTAVTAPATALSSEPHLECFCLYYRAKRSLL